MMRISYDNKLEGMVICGDIKPEKIEVFYEDGAPYLKYSGRSAAYIDINSNEIIPIVIEIPRISLKLERVKNIEIDDPFSFIPQRHAYINFEILGNIDFKVDGRCKHQDYT